MGTPTNRTPVRVARGSTTALNTGLSDIQEGEIVWDTTLNKLQVKEGSALENHTVDTSTLAPLAGADFTGPINVGVDDTGHDVKFFGATAGKYCLWDENQNRLEIEGGLQVNANDTATFKGQTTLEGQVNFAQSGSGDQNVTIGGGDLVFGKTVGNAGFQPSLKMDYDKFEAYYQGNVALSTSSSGIQVTSDGTGIPGLQGQLGVGSSGNCQISAFSDNGNNSAEDNNTLKIYSQHGTNNTTKTGILYQSFFDQVWRVKGEGGSGCSGITNAELGRINHDGGWELRYHDVQGTAPNWTGTTCDKKLETTSGGVDVTGDLDVSGAITSTTNTSTHTLGGTLEVGGPGGTDDGIIKLRSRGFNITANSSGWGGQSNAGYTQYNTIIQSGNEDLFINVDNSTKFIIRGSVSSSQGNQGTEELARFTPGAGVELMYDNSKKLETTTAGVTITGTVTDSKGDVRTIPESSSATNIVTADAGKFIPIQAGIILDTNTAFTAGQAVTLYNSQNTNNDEVITVTGVTLYLATDPTASGNRTLAGRGVATILCVASNTYVISGAGLT